ncbi:MAG: carboxypeptidase-like regulatory domain-containing protein [Planctomycetota bacterium]
MKPWLHFFAGGVSGVAACVLIYLLFLSPSDDRIALQAPSPHSDPLPLGSATTSGPEADPETGDRPVNAPSEKPPPPSEGPTEAPSSSPPPPPSFQPAIVHGRVVFGDRREPLSQILVRFARDEKYYLECTTEEDGSFIGGLTRPGTWKVIAFPYGDEGFRPLAEVIGRAGETVRVELVVPERIEFRLSGKVTSAEGGGIDGVSVSLSGYVRHGSSLRERTRTSGGGGYAFPPLEVPLPKPKGMGPRRVQDRDIEWMRRAHMRRFSGPRVSVRFSHPGYGDENEQVPLHMAVEGAITLDVILRCSGVVRGTVVWPEGEDGEDAAIPYRIVQGLSWSGDTVEIEGNQFEIKIDSAGRLIIGGRVGEYWIREMDLGMVDRSTVKDGITVVFSRLQWHPILLVDQNGGPLKKDIRDHLRVSMGEEGESLLGFDDIEIKEGRIQFPLVFSEPVKLSIDGEGITRSMTKIRPGHLPDQIAVEVLAPLMVGKLVLPPGFQDFTKIRVKIEADHGGGSWSSSHSLPLLDKATGAFRLLKDGDMAPGADLTVTITIPGFKPWVKAKFQLKKGETVENVIVQFKK